MDRTIQNMTYNNQESINGINNDWLGEHRAYIDIYQRLCKHAKFVHENEKNILKRREILEQIQNPDWDVKRFVLHQEIIHCDNKIQFVRYKLQLKLCWDHYKKRLLCEKQLKFDLLCLSHAEDEEGEIRALLKEKEALREELKKTKPPTSNRCCIC